VEEDQFHFVFSALDFISDEYPYWNRQNGRDHVFAFTHDFGACFTYHEEDTFKTERIQVLRVLHNSILLQYLGDLKSACFQTRKDIVIPPLITNARLLGGRGGKSNGPASKKSVGVYFRGKIRFHGEQTRPGYSRGVREQINTTATNNPYFSINEGTSPSYIEELLDAKFCLAPPGYALWTPRLAESVLIGCVPLVVGDSLELPFEWKLDYRSFAVRVAEREVDSIENVTKSIADSTLEAKKSHLKEVWNRFVYNEPTQKGDAFDTIMERLAMRVKERKPVGNYEFGLSSFAS
jgi:hypothetical protein